MGWIKRTWVDRTVVNQDRLVNGRKENEMLVPLRMTWYSLRRIGKSQKGYSCCYFYRPQFSLDRLTNFLRVYRQNSRTGCLLLFKIINKSGVPFRLIYGRVGYSPPSPPREGWGIRFSVKYPTPQANPRRQRGGSKVFFVFDFFLNNSDEIMVLYQAFGYLARLFSFVALFLTFFQRRSCAIMVLFFLSFYFRNMPNLSKAIYNQVDHQFNSGQTTKFLRILH